MLLKNYSVKIIRIIHLLLILYVIVGPFLSIKHTKNVINLLIFILYRWIFNDDNCTLTMIENELVGTNQGFIYRIVNPIYNISENKLNKELYFFTFSWLIILILHLVS